MRTRGMIAALLIGFAVMGPGPAGATAAHHAASKRAADPCGYRYAAWSVVQDSASYINAIAAGSTSDTYTEEMTAAWIRIRLFDMRADYGIPKNAQAIFQAFNTGVSADMGDAVKEGGDISFYLNGANKAQAEMWSLIRNTCAWKGKAFTWLGYLNAYGKSIQTTTRIFHTTRAWTLWWDFDCGDTGTTNFAATVETPSGGIVRLAANEIKDSDIGFSLFNRGGWYKVQVLTTCPWHLKATN